MKREGGNLAHSLGRKCPLLSSSSHDILLLSAGFYAGQKERDAFLEQKNVDFLHLSSQKAWRNVPCDWFQRKCDYTYSVDSASGAIPEAAEMDEVK